MYKLYNNIRVLFFFAEQKKYVQAKCKYSDEIIIKFEVLVAPTKFFSLNTLLQLIIIYLHPQLVEISQLCGPIHHTEKNRDRPWNCKSPLIAGVMNP